jgi:hypothetical protein
VVRLLAEIDGHAVPLSDCDWVKWAPCGCPVGVTVARLAVTEEEAWKAFYDRKRDIDRAQRRGYRMELVTHARWGAEVKHLMASPCPHKAGGEGDGD